MDNQSTPLQLYWVDAFTRTRFTGNPAVVIPDADGLTTVQMQQIAREVNCSETAFVLPAKHPEADLKLRWMTPTQEVDLCGHATVATFHTLAQLGRFNLLPGTHQFLYLESRSGILPIAVDYASTESPWIWLTLPGCDFITLGLDLAQSLQRALGLSTSARCSHLPVQDTLNNDVLIEVESLSLLHGLQPDLNALAVLGKRHGWRGICVYTQETLVAEHWGHSRFFAPQSGIPEDPVTGSVSGPLAVYLAQRREKQGQSLPSYDLILEQGDCLGRAGRVRIQLTGNRPRLGGQAVMVLQGEMTL